MSFTAIVNWKANQMYNKNAKKLIKATQHNPANRLWTMDARLN